MYGFSQGSLCLLLYFIICVAVVFSIRLLFRIPTEVFRKLLHWVLLGSLAVWLWAFAQWQHALLAVACFLVLVWPGSAAAAYFDRICSVVVSCYLLQCGARTVKENRKR